MLIIKNALVLYTGLSLTFFVNQDEYVGTVADSAGLRVVVHDQSQMPFPEYESLAVGPGQATYIGVTMVRSRVSVKDFLAVSFKDQTDISGIDPVSFKYRTDISGLTLLGCFTSYQLMFNSYTFLRFPFYVIILPISTQSKVNRIGAPYDDCIDPTNKRIDIDVYEEIYDQVEYSQLVSIQKRFHSYLWSFYNYCMKRLKKKAHATAKHSRACLNSGFECLHELFIFSLTGLKFKKIDNRSMHMAEQYLIC